MKPLNYTVHPGMLSPEQFKQLYQQVRVRESFKRFDKAHRGSLRPHEVRVARPPSPRPARGACGPTALPPTGPDLLSAKPGRMAFVRVACSARTDRYSIAPLARRLPRAPPIIACLLYSST